MSMKQVVYRHHLHKLYNSRKQLFLSFSLSIEVNTSKKKWWKTYYLLQGTDMS